MWPVTPEDVRRTRFATPTPGHRAYHADEVDAFLELVAATLAGEGELAADDLRRVGFGPPRLGRRGYRADQVDEYLDQLRVELEFRQRGVRPVPGANGDGHSLLTADDVRRMRFTHAPVGRRGYDEEEVAAFLDLVTATLAHGGPGSLTIDDVQAVRFTEARLGTRGYQRDEVDAFLDLVAAALRRRR
ncbi:DivIVA domain-containing protein [Streptomyces gardneri]|uniref:DivIVA domain-containing protein n=1 Tax=Nocardia TaxID=1817 RepID=UPI0013597922|nr:MULTISPECIES: DivIVA domain-containing protein [Nocardia]MBF6169574.1 DivIVA domain-containing protein [Streptomyces gardneri]MBF6209169.1 DivIVA domain-containing protein [Streptomyces gardneri]